MNEKDKDQLRNLSDIIKEENIEKGFDSISEIPNSSFDNRKNNSFITDQSIDSKPFIITSQPQSQPKQLKCKEEK
jgi:hypothetical protein